VRCLVIYDIPDDRVRTRVADACLDYGLARLQYSAYGGRLSRVHQRELLVTIRQRVGREACNVQLFAFDEACWETRRTIEQGGGDG
jgi:CRISPR-associated protein Cas2